MAAKNSLEQQVSPKWKFLHENFGFKAAMNLFPPYIGAGVEVDAISDDFTYIKVSMNLTWFNENYVGTHFGGSLYSMCDPFYMFILMNNLGKEYLVWDKKSEIDFVSPGTGRVWVEFTISPEQLAEIKNTVARQRKTNEVFICEVKDEQNKVVARVTKTLYIRKLKSNATGNLTLHQKTSSAPNQR